MVFQGYGGRNRRVDPEAAWRGLETLLDRSVRERAPVYSLVMMRNSNASFHLAQGTSLYESVPLWAALMALTPQERRVAMRDPSTRAALSRRHRPSEPTVPPPARHPPPSWDGLRVRARSAPRTAKYERRSIQEIATGQSNDARSTSCSTSHWPTTCAPVFHWSNEIDGAARRAAATCSSIRMVLPGISDGGAHLDCDDGAEWSTYFLRMWCLDEGGWPLEAAIRRLTAVPAAVLGLTDRGLLQPGRAADVFVFDPQRLTLGKRRKDHDRITGTARFRSSAIGVRATVVNGTVVVDDDVPTGALPGQVVRPT